ncbi:hypothetical protein LEP1GSC060_2781 [Leptospira weilii serovar Ranarum str. ICFT]|uniref:Uncharacterized protein n=1 Tax=Leptospira weilii serovar Ranarum str. ICFT TaxID=1218598 RepID=N1WMK6_9LEPT|nr:hypothetical protein LEP1GSC060_2781 [Leptospira weilii serovar Ranarum str. ICFT]
MQYIVFNFNLLTPHQSHSLYRTRVILEYLEFRNESRFKGGISGILLLLIPNTFPKSEWA